MGGYHNRIGKRETKFLAMEITMNTETIGLNASKEAEFVAENELATALGVPLDRLRAVRMEAVEPSETKKEGRRVLLSRMAVERVSELLRCPEVVLEKKEEGGAVAARVSKVPMNPRIVFARLESGEEIRVRVRDSKKFVVGMMLKARAGDGGVYLLEGRGPRFKGRW
jgi:hypothetical protein